MNSVYMYIVIVICTMQKVSFAMPRTTLGLDTLQDNITFLDKVESRNTVLISNLSRLIFEGVISSQENLTVYFGYLKDDASFSFKCIIHTNDCQPRQSNCYCSETDHQHKFNFLVNLTADTKLSKRTFKGYFINSKGREINSTQQISEILEISSKEQTTKESENTIRINKEENESIQFLWLLLLLLLLLFAIAVFCSYITKHMTLMQNQQKQNERLQQLNNLAVKISEPRIQPAQDELQGEVKSIKDELDMLDSKLNHFLNNTSQCFLLTALNKHLVNKCLRKKVEDLQHNIIGLQKYAQELQDKLENLSVGQPEIELQPPVQVEHSNAENTFGGQFMLRAYWQNNENNHEAASQSCQVHEGSSRTQATDKKDAQAAEITRLWKTDETEI